MAARLEWLNTPALGRFGSTVVGVLSIFFVGVAFTMARERTNSVAASFLMHCGYNFALFAMLWLASDHYRHLERVAN